MRNTLSSPLTFQALDRLIDRARRIVDANMKKKPAQLDRKVLPKSA